MSTFLKIVFVSLIYLSVSGCGYFDRKIASITGNASETCHAGVVYLQFTSGVSVKYNPDGTIATCK